AVVAGRRAADLLAGGALDGADAALIDRVVAGERVVVAALGLTGDLGGSRATAWLVTAPEARRALLAAYPAHLGGRAGVRRATRLEVTDAPFFMAPGFAFDGRAP